MFRYEDILQDPYAIYKKFYSFINKDTSDTVWADTIDQNDKVYRWLQTSSNISDHRSFGSKRDIKEQMVKWRSKIDMKTVNTVQNLCKNTMLQFGYKMVKSTKELRDLNHSLLLQ